MKYEISSEEIAILNFWYGFLIADSKTEDDPMFENAFNSFENFVMRITKEQQEAKKK